MESGKAYPLYTFENADNCEQPPMTAVCCPCVETKLTATEKSATDGN